MASPNNNIPLSVCGTAHFNVADCTCSLRARYWMQFTREGALGCNALQRARYFASWLLDLYPDLALTCSSHFSFRFSRLSFCSDETQESLKMSRSIAGTLVIASQTCRSAVMSLLYAHGLVISVRSCNAAVDKLMSARFLLYLCRINT
jgi:hypothetical protein